MSEKRYKNHKNRYIVYLVAGVFFFTLIGIIVKQNQPTMPDNGAKTAIIKDQPDKLDKSAQKTGESRNEFTIRMVANPQKIDWTGETLFFKVIQFLENPQTNIVQLFDGKIKQLEAEEYYAGAYYLQDHLYCELLWISNNNQLSLGFKISGATQELKKLESMIESTLRKPSVETNQENYHKKGWYNKVYNNMKYDIEYTCDTQGTKSTLTMNIHPHIYH